MNVVEVTYNWPAEVFIQRHLEALNHTSVNIQVVARHQKPSYAGTASVKAEKPNSRISVSVMPNFDHLSSSEKIFSLHHLLRGWNGLNYARPVRDRVLLTYFRKLKPDLIHFHASSLAIGMRWLPEELEIPYTLSLRGSDIQVMPLRSDDNRNKLREALEGASGIHAVCNNLGELAQKYGHTGFSPKTIYTVLPFPNQLPTYPSTNYDEIRFISIGRIHWRKGFPNLMLALRHLRDLGVASSLSLIGVGPDEERCRSWIRKLELEEFVYFEAKLNFEQIKTQLANSHAYIQSSIAEGLSNATTEAMAYGCPVFATDVGGTAEVIHDGENGFLLDTLKPETWSQKLALARDRELMKTIRSAAYDTAQMTFNSNAHAESFLQFFEAAINRPHPRHEINQLSTKDASFDRLEPEQDEELDGTIIFIVGRWQWQNGIDLILKTIWEMKSANLTDSNYYFLFGYGPQEDELRYLVDFLDLSEWIQIHASKVENYEEERESWLSRAAVCIQVEKDRKWMITSDRRKMSIKNGDVKQLTQCLTEVMADLLAISPDV